MHNFIRKNILALALVLGLGLTAPVLAGTYNSSAHGNTTTGVSGRVSGYSTGNCGQCHDQHASRAATTHAPYAYAVGLSEENLCLDCHDGSPVAGNISAIVAKTYRHNAASYTGKHKYNETKAEIAANQHVECTDCHNPHETKATNHTAGTTGNAVSNPLAGVQGAAATFSATNWVAPTAYTLQSATKEYEICFKCHSGANTNWANWDGAAAAAWSDVGLEFNTKNKSLHPVTTTLNAATNSVKLAAAQLKAPWSTTPGDNTMYCSDCHNVDSGTVLGPHGSNTKWMLSGANKAWPYTAVGSNGTSAAAGTLFSLNGSTTNLFCMNCHPDPTSNSSNNVHKKNDHNGTDCVSCHIRVPHGGKVSRLINANNNGSGSLPARYFPDGNGGGSVLMVKFTRNTDKDSYSGSDCDATCNHSGGSENW